MLEISYNWFCKHCFYLLLTLVVVVVVFYVFVQLFISILFSLFTLALCAQLVCLLSRCLPVHPKTPACLRVCLSCAVGVTRIGWETIWTVWYSRRAGRVSRLQQRRGNYFFLFILVFLFPLHSLCLLSFLPSFPLLSFRNVSKVYNALNNWCTVREAPLSDSISSSSLYFFECVFNFGRESWFFPSSPLFLCYHTHRPCVCFSCCCYRSPQWSRVIPVCVCVQNSVLQWAKGGWIE